MAYSKSVYQRAKSVMSDRRRKAVTAAQSNLEKIYKEIPRIKEIDKNLSNTSIYIAKSVINGGSVTEELKKLKDSNRELQDERKALLKAYGYDENADEPKYACTKCDDKGMIEKDGKTVYCECFKKLLTDIACEELNKISPLALSTFDTFKLSYYPQELSQQSASPYKRMSKIYDFCINYAFTFSPASKSLLIRGNTGLGKTHLSLAIANEVLKKGFGVVYVSAPDILSKLEKEHFSYDYESENQTLDTLLECDLLIIDDLGTEFKTQYSTSCIYNIFNSRILSQKPIIINTNMTLKELESAYSERFVSRVIGSCDRLDFIGKDIRSLK